MLCLFPCGHTVKRRTMDYRRNKILRKRISCGQTRIVSVMIFSYWTRRRSKIWHQLLDVVVVIRQEKKYCGKSNFMTYRERPNCHPRVAGTKAAINADWLFSQLNRTGHDDSPPPHKHTSLRCQHLPNHRIKTPGVNEGDTHSNS